MKSLVIGYGSIGKRHIVNLSKIQKMTIIVCTKRKYDNFLKKHNCLVFSSLSDCIDQKPDFGIISNETSLHVKTAIKLAKAGINFIVEKPLSNNLSDLNKLSKLVNHKRLVTFVTCPLRFNPCIKKIKELLEKNKIGHIFSIIVENGSFLPEWHKNEDYKKNYASKKELGGGVILTSIHELDYVKWFFGSVKEVFSISKKISNLKINVEDISYILMNMNNNIVASIHLDYFQKPSFRSCKIIGENGTIYWNSDNNSVKLFNSKKNCWETKLKIEHYIINDLYIDELKYFLNCHKHNIKTMNDVDDGIDTLKIALSIKKSSKMKKMVTKFD